MTGIEHLIPSDLTPVSLQELKSSNDITLWEKFYNYDFFVNQIKGYGIDVKNPYHKFEFPKISTLISLHYPEYLELLILTKDLPDSISIADIGCGLGNFLCYLWEYGYRDLYGIDCSRDILNVAKWNAMRRGIKQIHWGWAMAHKLPFEDNSITVVRSSDLIEHLSNPQLFFEEAKRVLDKEYGTFLATFPIDTHLDTDISEGHLIQYRDGEELEKTLRSYFNQLAIYKIKNYWNSGTDKFFVTACDRRKEE